jgi:hypothetical protein
MVDPAKEYSTHSNGLEIYMECVVLLCSMVIKESLKIPKGYSEAVNRQIIFYVARFSGLSIFEIIFQERHFN